MRKDGTQQNGSFRANGNSDRSNKLVQFADQEEYDDDDENYTVLRAEGDEENVKSYYMEGFINENRVKTMIKSGSPGTSFALDQLKNIMKHDILQVGAKHDKGRKVH